MTHSKSCSKIAMMKTYENDGHAHYGGVFQHKQSCRGHWKSWIRERTSLQRVRKLWNNGNDRRFDKNDNAVRMDGVCIRYASICDELPSVCRTWLWMNSTAVLPLTIIVYRNKLCFIILFNHFWMNNSWF